MTFSSAGAFAHKFIHFQIEHALSVKKTDIERLEVRGADQPLGWGSSALHDLDTVVVSRVREFVPDWDGPHLLFGFRGLPRAQVL